MRVGFTVSSGRSDSPLTVFSADAAAAFVRAMHDTAADFGLVVRFTLSRWEG